MGGAADQRRHVLDGDRCQHAVGLLSLLADSIAFAGDALNHGVSLAVLAWALAWRAGLQVLRQARAELSGEIPNSHAHEHQR